GRRGFSKEWTRIIDVKSTKGTIQSLIVNLGGVWLLKHLENHINGPVW
ncbi:13990_t:CDS:1, partial [Acaulospora colombiana]